MSAVERSGGVLGLTFKETLRGILNLAPTTPIFEGAWGPTPRPGNEGRRLQGKRLTKGSRTSSMWFASSLHNVVFQAFNVGLMHSATTG